MNLLRYLGIQKKKTKSKNPSHKDVLCLWEDDYLMRELLPYENLEFVKSETARISDFGREHADGIGFTDITPIGEKPFKTIERLIDITEVESIMTDAGLIKLDQFFIQGEGLIQDDNRTIGFGTNRFAIMCDRQNNLLHNIWLTGHTTTEDEKQILVNALLEFGQSFNFIAINWYHDDYYNLIERNSVEEFVKNSC